MYKYTLGSKSVNKVTKVFGSYNALDGSIKYNVRFVLLLTMDEYTGFL